MLVEKWKMVEGLEKRLCELEAEMQALKKSNENPAA
jgi:hypothetical protein